eukprot:6172841-Amphidinium_carterae.1
MIIEETIGMIKMNLKLPTPTQYDKKSPQFNKWAGEVKSYLTVHNIYIEDLMDDSTKSQVPMVIATMQRDSVADDLQRFNARYPQSLIVMMNSTTTTWIDGKQWKKRSQTLLNSARSWTMCYSMLQSKDQSHTPL